MTDWTLPIEGSCRCGKTRLRLSKPPMITMACHCTGCQKMTSSAFSLSAAFPSDGFEVVSGEPVPGGLRKDVEHYFCPDCMTWVFSRMPGMDWFVNVRSTLLDEPARFAPYVEAWTDEKLPFAETGASRSYPGFPPMEDYEPLMKDFAARA